MNRKCSGKDDSYKNDYDGYRWLRDSLKKPLGKNANDKSDA